MWLMSDNQRQRRNYLILRYDALMIIGHGKIECAKCGNSDIDVLEINHIYGGGEMEREILNGEAFLSAILDLDRPTDDLNILCGNCHNRQHRSSSLSVKEARSDFIDSLIESLKSKDNPRGP